MRTSTISIAIFSILLASPPLQGCGWLRWTSSRSSKKTETVVRRTVRGQGPVQEATDVEVLWEIPSVPVDGFIISYGLGEGELSRRITVKANVLQRYEDQRYGFVYRYVLRDIPTDTSLKVTISSFRGEKVSESSKVIIVPQAEAALSG